MITDSRQTDWDRATLPLIDQQLEIGFIVLNESGTILFSSAGLTRSLGYSKAELANKKLEVLFLPDEKHQPAAIAGQLLTQAKQERTSGTGWLWHRNGSQALRKYTVFALQEAEQSSDGASFGFLLQDPLEDGEQSQTLKAIVNALEQSTVLVRTFEGVITHWTNGCERLYGYNRANAVGQICKELLQANLPEPIETINLQLLLHGSWAGEVEHVRRDGSHINVSTNFTLVRDADGKPGSVIETITDITARVEAQRQLELAHERLQSMTVELERSNAELEEFARIASHDLTAPLVSARWLTDILISRQSEKLDEEAQGYLRQISVSLNRMTELVDAVLKHAQVGTSSVTASQAMPLAEAVDAAVQDLKQQINGTGAIVRFGPLPSIRLEANALHQLLQNILSNAIKYRSAAAPVIEVTALWTPPQWTIAIRDNGVGIDSAWHEHIFRPMQRLHGSEINGSGIGLATCRKIVTRAGGRIWVQSQRGEGSTFFFTLPGEPPA